MNDLLNLYGILGYGATVGLIVIWISIGLSYARFQRRWYLFVASFSAYAILFAALTLVASAAPWIDRTSNMLINRTAVWAGVLLGAVFTWRYLRANARR